MRDRRQRDKPDSAVKTHALEDNGNSKTATPAATAAAAVPARRRMSKRSIPLRHYTTSWRPLRTSSPRSTLSSFDGAFQLHRLGRIFSQQRHALPLWDLRFQDQFVATCQRSVPLWCVQIMAESNVKAMEELSLDEREMPRLKANRESLVLPTGQGFEQEQICPREHPDSSGSWYHCAVSVLRITPRVRKGDAARKLVVHRADADGAKSRRLRRAC